MQIKTTRPLKPLGMIRQTTAPVGTGVDLCAWLAERQTGRPLWEAGQPVLKKLTVHWPHDLATPHLGTDLGNENTSTLLSVNTRSMTRGSRSGHGLHVPYLTFNG